MKKFTFKTEKPTGKWRSFHQPTHYIKLGREICGHIDPENFTISLMIIKNDINEDSNPNCSWKWIRLKKESKTLQEAKDFLNENIEVLLSKYNIHKHRN
ncbi:MAG: hypothetical protein JETCAE03_33530 [Ignavibacteriaceae bacterium]|nr:MAG: hypothetical protein JETCAE03_33530 [Ignavibacteriaceae bacterium]